MVHAEMTDDANVTAKEKLVPKEEPEPMEEERQAGVDHDEDSDVVVFGDQEDSPELEIIEVKKRPVEQKEATEEPEPTRKRQKLE
jgi:hypothetical protein